MTLSSLLFGVGMTILEPLIAKYGIRPSDLADAAGGW